MEKHEGVTVLDALRNESKNAYVLKKLLFTMFMMLILPVVAFFFMRDVIFSWNDEIASDDEIRMKTILSVVVSVLVVIAIIVGYVVSAFMEDDDDDEDQDPKSKINKSKALTGEAAAQQQKSDTKKDQ